MDDMLLYLCMNTIATRRRYVSFIHSKATEVYLSDYYALMCETFLLSTHIHMSEIVEKEQVL